MGHEARPRLDPGQVEPPDAVGPLVELLVGDLEGEPALAHAARPDERDQPVEVEALAHLAHQLLAADERGQGRGQGTRRRGRRRGEVGVVTQDRALQLLQLRGRLDAELVGEQAADPLVGRQGVGPALGAVQREHQLGPAPFPQRLLGHQRLELGHDLLVVPEGEPSVDAQFARGRPQFLEPHGLASPELAVGEVAERRAPPEPLRLLGQEQGTAGVVAGRCLPCRAGQAGQPNRVDVVRVEAQPVAGPDRGDRALGQRLAEPGDVAVQRLRRRGWRVLTPQRVDKCRAGHDLTTAQREHLEHGSLLGGLDLDRRSLDHHLERPEQSHLHDGRR